MTRETTTETLLSGGRTNLQVIRIGNTVRRSPRPNSEFVQTFLAYLHEHGFPNVPEPLGTDEKGREVLSFIEGDVPDDLGVYGDDVLVAAAKLIRAYHDASRGFVPRLEIVCHNDLSPCNFVFREGKPVAIIDFEAAAPGSRVMDVSYAAWLWLDLGSDEVGVAEQKRRFEIFLKSYGDITSKAMTEAMLSRQKMLILEGERLGNSAMTTWAKESRAWTLEHFGSSYV
jgi:aminoglycoside phosphotransferase (APT) family kinase protein